jgi:hypothetical protein
MKKEKKEEEKIKRKERAAVKKRAREMGKGTDGQGDEILIEGDATGNEEDNNDADSGHDDDDVAKDVNVDGGI